MDDFTLVGARPQDALPLSAKTPWYKGKPVISILVLGLIVLGCLLWSAFSKTDAGYMDLSACNLAPSRSHLFGTDTMGRDIFAMIWSGGRLSLIIGVCSTLLSTFIAVFFGSLSGCAGERLGGLLTRVNEIFISIPNLLLIVLLQAILGQANAGSISVTIGLTSWASIAKIVRTEVRQLRHSEYVLAARAMGGGFFHVLMRHLFPNFFSAILFMVVMNLRGAIVAESTLSFLGLGLPLEAVSWGIMLSLSEKALLSGAWWVILIPGAFLIAVLLCVTNLGNYLRRQASRKESNL